MLATRPSNPVLVTSPSNPAIKFIRKLAARKERERSGLFFADGVRVTLTALETGARVQALVLAADLAGERARAAARRAAARGLRVIEVSERVYRSLVPDDEPSGLGALVAARPRPIAAANPTAGLCWIALDGVQYPGNLGTILRTGDAVGAAGVILLGSATDPHHPAAVRASMGAVFTQAVLRATHGEFLAWAARSGVHLVGASGEGATTYRAAALSRPLALVLGSERDGLAPALKAACRELVSLPMLGRADSLNLSVAAGVLLYEVLARRNPPGPG